MISKHELNSLLVFFTILLFINTLPLFGAGAGTLLLLLTAVAVGPVTIPLCGVLRAFLKEGVITAAVDKAGITKEIIEEVYEVPVQIEWISGHPVIIPLE